MDRIQHIYQLQNELDQKIIKERNLSHILFEEWMQKDCIAIISELSELMEEVNYKWWKNPKVLDKKRIHEELIDVFHFFVSMCIKADLTPEDLYAGYLEKNKENVERQDGKSRKQGYNSIL